MNILMKPATCFSLLLIGILGCQSSTTAPSKPLAITDEDPPLEVKADQTSATKTHRPTPDQPETSEPVATYSTPTFSGEIEHFLSGNDLQEFLFAHDGKIVYLDVYFDDLPDSNPEAISSWEEGFTLWSNCIDLPTNQVPSSMHCTGVSINVYDQDSPENIWGYNQGVQYLKGYWTVTAIPGMHQGLLSLSLNAASVRDL